ncbi:hypothetical protein ACUXCC_003471 [Cytobacillus horneckiae]|uniref:hypothetical protein n=1 Tax=Cytobacillus horneckiae TaxID=549687 RepID=UPI0019D0E60C|nr:hypothetical protein [Cytobacillus horneckiae]MBN6889905.1 hypothetical protein [Cytobacillus horneckiae]
MAVIKAPNKAFNGIVASVVFQNGVGETDDKWLKNWFGGKGYEVEETTSEDKKINQRKNHRATGE